MRDTVNCKVCEQPFSYERTYRPRIYCDACRGPAYKAHTVGSYNPEYEKWYRENVRKPRAASQVLSQDGARK